MKCSPSLIASACLLCALSSSTAFAESVSLGIFNAELNNASGTLSNASSTGFTIAFPATDIGTNLDTRTILSASARGTSIGVGETAVFSFTVSSDQIRDSSVTGFAFGFGFDMGPVIATTQMDAGGYTYTFLRSGAGVSGFPFAAVAAGAGNSSKGANSWVAASEPVPAVPLSTGSKLPITVELSRIDNDNYTQVVRIAGSSVYSSQFPLSSSSISTVYVLVGGSGFHALDTGDQVTVTDATLKIVATTEQ